MKNKYSIDNYILVFISISIVLADFIIGFLSFGDICLFIACLLVLYNRILNGNLQIKISYLLIFFFLGLLILTNFFINLNSNSEFLIAEGLVGLIKFLYYSFTLIILINFIGNKKLEEKLLIITNKVALIVCFIGIYITIAIYLNGAIPYSFFWKFTRSDYDSYMFVTSIASIVRTRSIFSEPAHLGFYLNLVLSVIYFNKINFKIRGFSNVLITLTIILTLSFSAIGTMIVIKFLYYLDFRKILALIKSKLSILGIFAITIITVFLGNFIKLAIFDRLKWMLNGQDTSATVRLIETWSYIKKENIYWGNGIGNTPYISNVYSYVLSDLGLLAFSIYILLSIYLVRKNYKLGIIFFLLNIVKGGYLASGYWVFLLFLLVFVKKQRTF